MSKIIATLLFLLASSVNALPLEDYDISKSWEKAEVYVPGNFFTRQINTVEVTTPMPVVVLMHGCTGISPEETQWARLLKDNGYIVVLPNSFAIPNRIVNCSTTDRINNLRLVPVNRLRPAEVAYAMSQLKTMKWANKQRIFLMGHSEGAMAVTRTPDMGFKGIIVSGFICSLGVMASSATPILAISWSGDPYFPLKSFQCDSQWGDRNNGKLVLLQGQEHGTVSSVEARRAVISFLEQ
jgi:poly(3-hydroxybutyrate) depolymerase